MYTFPVTSIMSWILCMMAARMWWTQKVMCFLPAVLSTNGLWTLTPGRLRPGEWALSLFSFFLYTAIYTDKQTGRLRHVFPNISKGKKKSLLVPWNQREVCFPCEAELGRSFFPKLILALLTAWKHPMLLHIPLWYLLHYFPSYLFILFAGVPCLHHSYKTLHVCSALPVSRPLGLAFRCFQPCVWLATCLPSPGLFVFFNAE